MANGDTPIDDTASAPLNREILSKVPQVTVFFWIIKVLCTTVGETASDFLNVNLGLGLEGTSVAAGVCLALVLTWQFALRKYVPGVYWLAVVLISVFGTLITDILTDGLHFPLEASTVIFTVALGLTFGLWYAKERTLSIHSIFTRRREAFYWLAILFTFALGTATGDLMAEKLAIGYLATGLIVLGVITATGVAWRLGLDSVLGFWVAYVLTRPLGASLGDYLSQSKSNGGLGLGATVTSAVFLAAILTVVVYLAVSRRDSILDPESPSPSERQRPTAVRQTAVVLALMLVAGVTGYTVCRSHLRNEAVATVSTDRPLGDLSAFRTIVEDMSKRAAEGDLEGAKTRAADLETAWDDGQGRLQPLDPAKWDSMDKAIDDVLKKVRASHQDAAAIRASLGSLSRVLDSLDPRK